ncbi:F-box/WD repeat-containing protein 9 [Lampris incognitus]|uniref:F-box/WD repeat-containing protein 9 n=1 Tax=Lampris incognitus TaxID=2546036 RepID=UPI0024B53FDE|nr:F-box/WD repeat-containing protein 9 [Lampris incognitus]XP_056144504.1 F-box/WD repeat-containing protein 9 [Lampris incognitus]
MSEAWLNMEEEEAGIDRQRAEDQDGPLLDPVRPPTSETPRHDLLGPLAGPCPSSTESSPSPSVESSGLLSLPWEMMALIASHLPAQCVITVLPKVCHALGYVGKDSTAWQLRARRLTGSQAGFPVGPREDFDWPTACLEMEHLINCWASQADWVARQTQENNGEMGREAQQPRADEEPEAEGQEDAGVDVEDGVGVAAQEVAFGVPEMMEVPLDGEDRELQPDRESNPEGGMREDFEERPEEEAAAVMEEGRGEREVLDDSEGRERVVDEVDNHEFLPDPRCQALDVEDEVGIAAQEVAFGVPEMREVPLDGEDRELQPDRERYPEGGMREDFEERPEEEAAAVMEEGRGEREVLDDNEGRERVVDEVDNHEDLPDPRYQADREVEMGVQQDQPQRTPSPPPSLERITLSYGHSAQVDSVLLIGDKGAVCASGSRDRNVILWDLQEGSSGRMLCTLGGKGLYSTHRGWVWCLASKGPLLASGSFDSTVKLWDLEAGGAERSLIRAQAAVLCLSCQTDVLLAGTIDKRVSIYDTRVPEPLVKSLPLHKNAVMCLAADERYIISGSKDHTVAIYDRRAGKPLKRLRLSTYFLSMSYNGNEVWAGDNRGMLHAFSMQAGCLKTLSQFDVGHTSLVTGIHRSSGSLYTCSSDRTIKVHLPCAPPRTLCTLRHQAGVNGLSVEAGVLAIASGTMCVEVWRARK